MQFLDALAKSLVESDCEIEKRLDLLAMIRDISVETQQGIIMMLFKKEEKKFLTVPGEITEPSLKLKEDHDSFARQIIIWGRLWSFLDQGKAKYKELLLGLHQKKNRQQFMQELYQETCNIAQIESYLYSPRGLIIMDLLMYKVAAPFLRDWIAYFNEIRFQNRALHCMQIVSFV